MPTAVLLPVYLIHWDAPEWCASAASSILRSLSVQVELAIIDNGQTKGPPLAHLLSEAVRVLPQARNRGYTGGANAALADWAQYFPESDLCVIGSHDLHVEPTTLGNLVTIARLRPDCGIVAPVLTAPHPASGGVWTGWRSRQVGLRRVPEIIERDWASGTCLLLRRECASALGAFDERLGSYMEDVDYGLRANDHGWKVLVATSASAHGIGSSSPDALRRITANTVLLSGKRTGLAGALGSGALFAGWAAKGYVAALSPWRSRERRAISRDYASQRLRGLGDVIFSCRLVEVLRRHDKRVRADASRSADRRIP